ncbi:hypothetical protein GCM10009760_43500 [Kitasatospora kazusensis]|uniref:Prephenate/arogenate dehydrogenase domain-containing protein n=1 Tax=Kitasatospora kazusensis TaxID=407974 RepID=A0ABP5LR61_9ACTN
MVVGGSGAVGGLFVSCLASSDVEVLVVDGRPPEDGRLRYEQGDITDLGPHLAEELAAADLVLLAVPEPVAVAAVKAVAAVLRPDALLVDTLSVKQRIVAALRADAPGVEALSLNPMFAPSLGFEGRPVATVVVHDGPAARSLLDLIRLWGGRVVPVTSQEHDRLAGATQALTHAAVLGFGLALGGLGVGAAESRQIAPPPHQVLLAMLARITAGTPEVYWDVQAANPEAAAARQALADGVRRIADLLATGTEEDFAAALHEVRDGFGPELQHYRDLCARLFESV